MATMPASYTVDSSVNAFGVPLLDLQNRADNVGKRLVIGVAIARHLPACLPQILVIQRAAHEELFPDMYELPGGKCEPTDHTLLDTVVRETFEETGLHVVRILSKFPGFEYSTYKGAARQYNFVVEVEGGADQDPVLDPREHQAFAWVDRSDFERFPMSDSMRSIVAGALEVVSNVPSTSSSQSHG